MRPESDYNLVYQTTLVIALICFWLNFELGQFSTYLWRKTPFRHIAALLMHVLSSLTLGEEAHPGQGKTQDPSDAHCFVCVCVCVCVYIMGEREESQSLVVAH